MNRTVKAILYLLPAMYVTYKILFHMGSSGGTIKNLFEDFFLQIVISGVLILLYSIGWATVRGVQLLWTEKPEEESHGITSKLSDYSPFDRMVQEAVDNLPDVIRDKIDNVIVQTMDWPTDDQLKAVKIEQGHTLLGLHHGVPLKSRHPLAAIPPTYITVFQGPVGMVSKNPEEMKEAINRIVFHEFGHYVGLTEDELNKLGV